MAAREKRQLRRIEIDLRVHDSMVIAVLVAVGISAEACGSQAKAALAALAPAGRTADLTARGVAVTTLPYARRLRLSRRCRGRHYRRLTVIHHAHILATWIDLYKCCWGYS